MSAAADRLYDTTRNNGVYLRYDADTGVTGGYNPSRRSEAGGRTTILQ